MRYLQFNDICIDTHNQLLIKSGEQFPLAPKVYDLLVFFCLNSHRVISKDELMEKVWSGTIVTENAISRTLVKVRKALDDDPKEPKYIITVPKKGYRMIVEFIESEQVPQVDSDIHQDAHQTIESFSHTKSSPTELLNSEDLDKKIKRNKIGILNKPSFVNKLVSIAALIIVTLSVIFWFKQSASPLATKQIKPLTREVADESNPAVSPDLTKLAYTKIKPGKRSYINIENLSTKAKQSISHPRAKLSKPVWSPTEDKLAFLYQHNDVCVIYWAALNNIKNKDTWQAISECGSDSNPLFTFSPDGQYFYFNDRQSNTNGYQIFRVNLSTLQKDIVNQPITSGLGNYAFDISPNGTALVLLNSEFSPQTRIYTLDIENSSLSQTAQLPYLMRSVRWAHDGETILHPSPHPAYEIWQSNLAGDKLSVFASNSSRVKHLSRINNDEDFSFVSYLLNRDIYYQTSASAYSSPNNKVVRTLDNSSVMDYLPALANDSDQYAFVSKRSTTAEVYLSKVGSTDERDNKITRLTFFNNPVKIYHLVFSPNDSQLLIQADNQLFIVNLLDFSVKQLPIDNISINGASWRDENRLLLSTIKNNDWYAMQYSIENQALTSLPVGYQGAIFVPEHNSYYFLADENGQVIKLNEKTNEASPTQLFCTTSFIDRKLNLIPTAKGLACLSNTTDKSLSHLIFETQVIESLSNLPKSLDFSANKNGVIYTKMTQSVADIMQTSSK